MPHPSQLSLPAQVTSFRAGLWLPGVPTACRPSLPPAWWSVLRPPPMSPCRLSPAPAPFLGGWGRGGGGLLSALRRMHVASTMQAQGAALVPLRGGVCRVAPFVALCTLCTRPRCSLRRGLARRELPSGTALWFRALSLRPPNPAALSAEGTLSVLSLSSSLPLGVGAWGRGGLAVYPPLLAVCPLSAWGFSRATLFCPLCALRSRPRLRAPLYFPFSLLPPYPAALSFGGHGTRCVWHWGPGTGTLRARMAL